MFTIVAVGMNILVGMTGLVSLGHAGLFAVGAYTSALLGTRLEVSFWLSAAAAIVVTGAVGSVLALAALRARGIYLAMVTIAFGIIVEQVALDQDEFTGGFMGISSIPYPAVGDFTFSAPWRLYLIAALAGACLWLASNLQRSRWGRGLLAVRESWVAAESLGVSRYRMETMAFALSAALAGLGGALFASQNAYIAPNIFAFDLSILMLLFVILGGLGTVWGPLIGTAVLLIIPELIAGFTQVRLVIYGAVMLACLYFMPQGIAGFIEGRRRERMRDAHRLPAPDVEGLKASIAQRRMPDGGGALVEVAGVSKAFGGLVALDDLTMEIRPGAIHSLIGPNGAGKTTLVNVLSGFYRPEAGEVRFAGDRVTGWSAHRMAARGVSRTFQATRLFPQLTVLANVMVGLHQHMDYGLAPALFSTPRTRAGETTGRSGGPGRARDRRILRRPARERRRSRLRPSAPGGDRPRPGDPARAAAARRARGGSERERDRGARQADRADPGSGGDGAPDRAPHGSRDGDLRSRDGARLRPQDRGGPARSGTGRPEGGGGVSRP